MPARTDGTSGVGNVGFRPRGATRRFGWLFAAITLLVGCSPTSAPPVTLTEPVNAQPTALPNAPRHVFVIVLENESFEAAFGPHSRAPYLAHALPDLGALLTQYYAIGHDSLDNYIAIISGQAPNPATQRDCRYYSEFKRTRPGFDAEGQILGEGCVYPADVLTVADQLQHAGFTWKGYMQDMGADPGREAPACAHPPIGARDHHNGATATDEYVDKHNPFIYFHSIIDNHGYCEAHVVNLDELPHDLARIDTTPNFAFITPDVCDDGHDAPCRNGQPGGLVSVNRFLQRWVPRILAAPAFHRDGLLIVTFDEGSSDEGCCDGTRPAGAPSPGRHGPGGGRIGAVVISPFIAPGTVSEVPYNHYSLLRSVEDWFGLPHLGYAGQAGVRPFGFDVFTRDHAPR